MIFRILASDRLKIRRSWIPFLTVLGPLGVIGLQIPNYAIRGEYLTSQGWNGLLFGQVLMLLYPALMLGITLLPAIIAGIEHDAHGWKQTFALPVSRLQVFVSKWLWVLVLLTISSFFVVIGIPALASYLGFTGPKPWEMIIKIPLYLFLASLPIISFHLWLSLILKNQALPIILGVLNALMIGASLLPQWIPWTFPFQVMEQLSGGEEPTSLLLTAIGIGLLIMIFGAINFARRDVK